MNELFLLTPSEALILGLTLGEYETKFATKPTEFPRFLEILKLRIKPHFPTFGEWEEVPMNKADVPTEIVWNGLPSGLKWGQTEQCPKTVYITIQGEVSCLRWTWPRKNFFDLLVIHLSDCLELKPIEHAMYGIDSLRTLRDTPSEIFNRITQLIRKNEFDHISDIGRKFGKLLALVDIFEDHVLRVTDPTDDHSVQVEPGDDTPRRLEETTVQFLKRRRGKYRSQSLEEFAPSFNVPTRTIANEIRVFGLVQRCHYAETILREVYDLDFVADDTGPSPFYFQVIEALNDTKRLHMYIWLAFGNLLGVLRDDDNIAIDTNSHSASPRAFQLAPDETPDAILARIKLVEKDLAAGENVLPVDIILRLNPLVESLAKRIWPKSFRGQKSELGSILHEKLLSNSTAERRFSGIAMNLHRLYRNPSQHSFDDFQCTFDEARYYVCGIRVLIDIWRQLGNG